MTQSSFLPTSADPHQLAQGIATIRPIRTLLLAAAMVLTTTAAASAQDIHISVGGKTAQAVHAEIEAAARRVCSDVGHDFVGLEGECVRDVVASTTQQLNALPAMNLQPSTTTKGR